AISPYPSSVWCHAVCDKLMQIGEIRVQDTFSWGAPCPFRIGLGTSEGLDGTACQAQLPSNLVFGHPLLEQHLDGLITGIAPRSVGGHRGPAARALTIEGRTLDGWSEWHVH